MDGSVDGFGGAEGERGEKSGGGGASQLSENRVATHKAEDDRPLLCSYLCRANNSIDKQCPGSLA